MKPAHTLNTWKVHTWAQVAQAVTWDDYALNSDAQVTVKATRGPVIVWGRRSGEGEDAPRLEAPTPSPLEVAADRVNMQRHALAFARAAHGKVRHSVRWRMRLARRTQLIAQYFVIYFDYNELPKSQCDSYFKWRKLSLGKRARRIGGGRTVRSDWRRHVSIYDSDGEGISSRFVLRFGIRFRDDGSPILDEFCKKASLIEMISRFSKLSDYRFWRMMSGLECAGSSPLEGLLSYATYLKDHSVAFSLARYERLKKAIHALRRAAVMRAAYRAHIARRVRPVSRRARVPRPLYARPRPPTCPLAPPVTC